MLFFSVNMFAQETDKDMTEGPVGGSNDKSQGSKRKPHKRT